ncbi:MAG: protein-L-isoaspartate(D-aspartate) O-methyltransferase [Elusimicrobia bacterium]|nr:protein-L-isoaspartate(D-aspartate) O-methyltransferase [Candidatus Obscuribacterium magneticum]
MSRKHVLDAMKKVPRRLFLEPSMESVAEDDRALPIGCGQTVSQPSLVAHMTQLLSLSGQDKVLEVGTGSGFQTAILAHLAKDVYTVEIVPALHEQAKQRLLLLGMTNVTFCLGDGYFGWPEQAPFDAIIVTAAAAHVPAPLVEQLKVGGRLVIPVGEPDDIQYLLFIKKKNDGTIQQKNVCPVRFVPLTGKH